jgi:hypothetical protein
MALQPILGLGLLFSWGSVTAVFYGVGLLAPRPTPNLEDQVSIFMTLGDRVAQLYPRALGSSGTSGVPLPVRTIVAPWWELQEMLPLLFSSKLLSSLLLFRTLKICVLNKTIILLVVLYKCDVWSLTLMNIQKLQVFGNKCSKLRNMKKKQFIFLLHKYKLLDLHIT